MAVSPSKSIAPISMESLIAATIAARTAPHISVNPTVTKGFPTNHRKRRRTRQHATTRRRSTRRMASRTFQSGSPLQVDAHLDTVARSDTQGSTNLHSGTDIALDATTTIHAKLNSSLGCMLSPLESLSLPKAASMPVPLKNRLKGSMYHAPATTAAAETSTSAFNKNRCTGSVIVRTLFILAYANEKCKPKKIDFGTFRYR